MKAIWIKTAVGLLMIGLWHSGGGRGLFADEKTDNVLRAKATLDLFADSAQDFADAHHGKYPGDVAEMTEGKTVYLQNNLCGKGIQGYSYSCTCRPDGSGCLFVAVPQEAGLEIQERRIGPGSGMLTIDSGQGILVSESRKSKQEQITQAVSGPAKAATEQEGLTREEPPAVTDSLGVLQSMDDKSSTDSPASRLVTGTGEVVEAGSNPLISEQSEPLNVDGTTSEEGAIEMGSGNGVLFNQR